MRLSILTLMLTIVFAGTTFGAMQEGKAKESGKKDTAGAMERTTEKNEVISINQLIGNSVENKQNEILGEIGNVLLDPRTGQVAYVLVSTGGFFSGETKVVPYDALEVSQDKIILDMDKQKLADAPSLEGEQSIEDFDRKSAEFFGVGPLWVE